MQQALAIAGTSHSWNEALVIFLSFLSLSAILSEIKEADSSFYLMTDCEPQGDLPLQGSPPSVVVALCFEGIHPDILHT